LTSGAHDHEDLAGRLSVLELPPPLTLFGVAATARAGRTEAEEADYLAGVLGRPIDLRYSFSPTLPGSYATAPFRFDTARLSLWSFKMTPATAATQMDGGSWSAFLDTVPAEPGRIYRFIYYQEPEDNMTPAEYLAGFAALKALTVRPDVLLGVNLKSWEFDPVANPSANGAAYIPPGADFVGLSLFTNTGDPRVNRDALGRAYLAVRERGIRFALSSIGVSAQQDQIKREAWMRHLAVFATHLAAHGDPLDHLVCYSSADPSFADYPWWLDGSPAMVTAWRDLRDLGCM
jgi:hypothetical protein